MTSNAIMILGNEMATGFKADRTVLRLTGGDCGDFLQGLVTNDVFAEGLIYAALLSPQGKYLFDFFVLKEGDSWLIDVDAKAAAALAQRLGMYKLRADVTIEASDLAVFQLWDSDLGHADPRNTNLGRRFYGAALPEPLTAGPDWTALRIAHLVPETGIELQSGDGYILEYGFERLHGVDFRKGCYVGQEIVARMKHKTTLRKGLEQVEVVGVVAPGSAIETAEGRAVGTIFSTAGGRGLGQLNFDRAKGPLRANGAVIRRL